ncbi:LuxR C-terminal-related transcriptional regulator [Streptomyces sp. NPDC001286]
MRQIGAMQGPDGRPALGVVVTAQEQGAKWPLTSRDSELEAFAGMFSDRRCQGVVIYGPAGVGKTRLAEEFFSFAVLQGWKGRRVTASSMAATVPLGALASMIPPGLDLSDPVASFAAVAGALAGPQRDRRWVIWVDDAHLLDAASAVLLRQLIDARVARLIATVRTGEPVGEAVDALCHGYQVQRIDLSLFDQAQVRHVLMAGLGGLVGRRTLHDLYAASGGNALYLHELVLGALRTGSLVNDGEIWELTQDRPMGTPRLAELIADRLAAAGPAARPVLEALALTEPLPLADAEQHAPPDVLAELEQGGLVQVTTSGRRTVLGLAHPLYGEVLRASIPAPRRRTLILEQVERTVAHGARRHDDVLRIAGWQLTATGAADPTLLRQAAGLARHVHDFPKVLALLEALPEGEQTTVTRLLHGEALWELGRWEQAEQLLARAESQVSDEQEKVAITLARAWNLWACGARTAPALEVLNSAAQQITGSAGKHTLRINEGCLYTLIGQPARGLALLADLERDGEHAPDISTWVQGAVFKTTGLALVGRAAEAAAWGQHAYSIHLRESKNVILAPHPASQLISLTLALTEAGQLVKAQVTGERAFTDVTTAHSFLPCVWAAFYSGRAHLLSGQAMEARSWYAQSIRLAHSYHHTRILNLALSELAASAALVGDLPAAETALADLQNPDPAQPEFLPGEDRLGLAWVLAIRGSLAEARAVLIEAAQSAHDHGQVASEALLLTDIARLGGAKDVVARLTELAQACQGALPSARARLAAALAADDPDRLLAAASELEEIGANLMAAEAAACAAAAWHRTAHARRATAAAHQAHSLAARCQGARTPLLSSAQNTSTLTAREREIALLAAAGTSSKDIADILHLSIRTVDNHLQRVYTKLGVTTRRELPEALG